MRPSAIRALGLVDIYRSKSATSSFLRMFFGIAFLQPDRVENLFPEDLMAHGPRRNRKIREFCEYVYNYIAMTQRDIHLPCGRSTHLAFAAQRTRARDFMPG